MGVWLCLSSRCGDAGRGRYPDGITVSGYAVVAMLATYVNSSHRLNKDEHLF